MAYEYKVTRRVEFSETDMAGIVHYSNFFRYMETAEHAFYRSLGFSVVTSVVTKGFETPLGWPRVHAECDYKKPLRFEDEVEIQMLVAEKKSRTLKYCFRFWKLSAGGREEVARGNLVVVCVTHNADGTMASVAIPPQIADQIQVAPEETLQ
jgi:acyl-CoA thioester hydrolase